LLIIKFIMNKKVERTSTGGSGEGKTAPESPQKVKPTTKGGTRKPVNSPGNQFHTERRARETRNTLRDRANTSSGTRVKKSGRRHALMNRTFDSNIFKPTEAFKRRMQNSASTTRYGPKAFQNETGPGAYDLETCFGTTMVPSHKKTFPSYSFKLRTRGQVISKMHI